MNRSNQTPPHEHASGYIVNTILMNKQKEPKQTPLKNMQEKSVQSEQRNKKKKKGQNKSTTAKRTQLSHEAKHPATMLKQEKVHCKGASLQHHHEDSARLLAFLLSLAGA